MTAPMHILHLGLGGCIPPPGCGFPHHDRAVRSIRRGPPEALPHPKISRRSGRCGTPSGGSHPAVRANTTKEAWGRPPPRRGSTGGSRGQTEDARGRRPRAVRRHGTSSPPACQRVRGVFRQHDRKIRVRWRHKSLRPLKHI